MLHFAKSSEPLLLKLKLFISRLKASRHLLPNYIYDFFRYLELSATADPYATKARFQGRIIATYHVIEKGLSLENPRTGFGLGMVNTLINLLENYSERYDWDNLAQVSLNTLFSYYEFNLKRGLENREIYSEIIRLKAKSANTCKSTAGGGAFTLNRDQVLLASHIKFRDFVNSRHSIRNFGAEAVSEETILEAISIALKTPSVCNRQTWKVHILCDDDLKEKALQLQNGNRGFGHTASKILIITSDLSCFLNAQERNQPFIDGGLFSMSLIYALHSLGVGSCCLNWAVTYEKDRDLRRDIEIAKSEVIIMMIAVGNLPKKFRVATSPRRSTQEITVIH